MTNEAGDQATDARVRRAAKRVRLRAEKSRCRIYSDNDQLGYWLIDEDNIVVEGWRHELSAEQVIEFCQDYEVR